MQRRWICVLKRDATVPGGPPLQISAALQNVAADADIRRFNRTHELAVLQPKQPETDEDVQEKDNGSERTTQATMLIGDALYSVVAAFCK